MQRTLCLIFAVLLLLSFCACENALGRNPQFAFVHSAEEDSYFRALAYSFTAARKTPSMGLSMRTRTCLRTP